LGFFGGGLRIPNPMIEKSLCQRTLCFPAIHDLMAVIT
jgi:hypothetical protein